MGGHTPLLIVHRRVVREGIAKPVMLLLGLLDVVIVAVPVTTIQLPVPTVGVLPDKVALVILHRSWSGPAFDELGDLSMLIVISSLLLGHTPLLIVHTKVSLEPIANPATPLLGSVGLFTVLVPVVTVQLPVPTIAVFPDSVAVVVLHSVWSPPAFAGVGNSSIVIIISSLVGGHTPFEIVHRKVVMDGVAKPVIVVLGSIGLEMVAVPLTTVQLPLPAVATFADSVAVAVLHSV